MLGHLLSGDLPRSRPLAALLALIVVALALAPFLVSSTRALEVAATVCIFVVLVASFDLLLGYTGVVSFAHTMFFGIGAYGVGIALARLGPTWTAVAVGVAAALAVSVSLAAVIALLSLRVRTTFFTMITLAVAVAFETVALQFADLTGGSDGLNLKVPPQLTPAFTFGDGTWLGTRLNGRFIAYYLLFATAVVLFLAMLRIVASPFGRVLQAIRENEFRAEAMGYRTVGYRAAATVLSAVFATLAGVLLAVWVRYVSPMTTLSMDIMLWVLLMVVIGGMGTLYGAIVGAVLFVLAQAYLQDLIGVVGGALAAVPGAGPLLAGLFSPDRWLLWLGLLFVVAVSSFPAGIVGELRARAARRALSRPQTHAATPAGPA